MGGRAGDWMNGKGTEGAAFPIHTLTDYPVRLYLTDSAAIFFKVLL